ncbi:FIG00925693: hypothetical protein, partial [hydrothermal vent metagenome]
KQFRSLHSGFQVEFHSLSNKGIDAMEKFRPFCFAGLNGSGKSNVLEALSSIFFHLESCVAKYKPKTFSNHFRRNECKPDAFTLEYLIGQHNSKPYALAYFDKIIIKKEIGKEPEMFRQAYPFSNNEELIPVSLEPRETSEYSEAADGKNYLPDIIVGYSSGENEILSIPFRKSRLINFDKYREDYSKNIKFDEPENSLIYIDNKLSEAVLLSCLLFENDKTLTPLRDELGIVGLSSFRMNFNVQDLFEQGSEKQKSSPILEHVQETIEKLKKCATSWYEHKENLEAINEGLQSVLSLDFFVDENTKKAFRAEFGTSFNLFRFLQVLFELNSIIVSETIKEEVYKSEGFYTDGKLPEGSPNQNVFYFLDFFIDKKIVGEDEPKELLLREFSDGEHQFIHTMGISLLLKDRRSLLLLDEPETHFNPNWRAKFIKMLDDSITAGNNGDFNVHLLKDILLSSHSPFIISDCMPNNVIFFDRNEETKEVQARKASEMGFNTYGTSVEIILDELFDYNQSIGDLANEELEKIDYSKIKSEEDVKSVKKLFNHLGDSIEKDLVLAHLNQLKLPKENA